MAQVEDKPNKTADKPDALSTNFNKELPALIAEFLFVLLPLFIVVIVRVLEATPSKIITAPEWAFGAAVLFGLTVVKFTMGFAAREHAFHWQMIGLFTAVLLVFGLVPSLIFLFALLEHPNACTWLGAVQILLFVLGGGCFMCLGTLGQMLANTAFQQRIAKMLGLFDKKDADKGASANPPSPPAQADG
jgi:hypothetical protein